MSTTVELLAANERYERLRAAVEELADRFEHDMGWNGVSLRLRKLLATA